MPTIRITSIMFLAITACLVVGASILPATAGDQAGMALAMDIYQRPDGSDVATRGIMILQEPGRAERSRELITLQLDQAGDRSLSLIRFSSPADIRDTALLMHDHPVEASDQWLYLPALDRIRRIASDRRGGRFVASDFFYEDIQKRHPSKDTHRLIGTETINGVATSRLESRPLDGGDSVYSRKISWVHPETLIAIRIDFYQGGKTPSKRLEVQRVESHQGYWTVMTSEMTDLESGHRTVLQTKAVVYDQGIPDSLFTTEALRDPTRAQAYLPGG